MAITDWANVLRKSVIFPYSVEEHNDWKNNKPLGVLLPEYLVWHHDGSPPGPSPGDVDWLINAYNAKQPSAQIIIGYDGTWHFVGSGVAYHAGNTDGIVTNFNSAGTETDQTTGETPSPKLLDSVRRGYASIFAYEKWPATRMRFHKMIARPVGRKPDPDFGTPGSSWNPTVWDTEYAREVAIIQDFIDNRVEKDWFDMATQKDLENAVYNALTPIRDELAEHRRILAVLVGAKDPVTKVGEKSIADQILDSHPRENDGNGFRTFVVDDSDRIVRIEQKVREIANVVNSPKG